MIYSILTFIAICAVSSGKIYFQENFNDAAWEKRWTVPTEWKPEVRASYASLVVYTL
jgi:hypothetical protein